MIYVKKPRKKIPQLFSAKAKEELPKAIKHYESPNPPKKIKSFKFTAYRCRELRTALETIFLYRCAYCESSYKQSSNVHIDHWRPKGAVLEGKVRFSPGYYWMAADWDNLFPACGLCNTRQTVETQDGTIRTCGKMDQFPLATARTRGAKRGDERKEKPLLLNPSVDKPQSHIVFCADQKDWGKIAPTIDSNGKVSTKGKVSIEVYALDRKKLVDTRRDQLTMLQLNLVELERNSQKFIRNQKNRDTRTTVEADVTRITLQCFGPSASYVGMSRQFLLPVLVRLWKHVPLRGLLQPLKDKVPGKFPK